MSRTTLAIATAILLTPVGQSSLAQEQTPTISLFEKFTEVGQKAEQRKDLVMAVGMYEAALERTISSPGQEFKYAETLTSIVRCYTDLGYYWRVELVAKKLLPVLEQQPKLFSSKTSDALKNYSRLLKKVGNERDCAKYEQLIEKLRSNQAIVNAAQVTER